MALKVKVDGIEYEAGSDSHLSALDKQTKTLTERADAAEAKAKAEAKRADDAAKSLEAEQAKAASEKKRADDAEAKADPKTIAARVNERVRLITTARDALKKRARADQNADAWKAASVYLADAVEAAATPDDAIIIKAIQALSPSYDPAGKSHEMLLGALEALCGQSGADESAEMGEPMDSANAPPPPAQGDPNDPNKMQPGAYDSKFAPRGKIGERVENPNLPTAAEMKTQAEALRERMRKDSLRWKETPAEAFTLPQPRR